MTDWFKTPLIYMFSLLILFGGQGIPSAYGADTQFFELLNDIPIMPGLEEIQNNTLVFDKAAGRIVQIDAFAHQNNPKLNTDSIMSFYDESLPQLGWQKVQKHTYIRENEKLEIYVRHENGFYIARFILSPTR